MTNIKHENDPTSHAEVVAIRNACKKLNAAYLEECVLYTTFEPCPMCAAAAIWANMKGIVFGATMFDAKVKLGNNFSWRQINIRCRDILKEEVPKLELTEEYMHDECVKLLG